MNISSTVVVIDAADIDALSTFWAGVLGGSVRTEPDWHDVVVDGETRLSIQLAPDHVPPQWPDGSKSQQLHLDIHIDDMATAHDEVMALGARVLKATDDLTTASGFQVYADPAGHPFCLVWG